MNEWWSQFHLRFRKPWSNNENSLQIKNAPKVDGTTGKESELLIKQ